MKYRELQRERSIALRDQLFHDPGKGIFFGKEREFVLQNPVLNLWEGIRYDVVDYFKRNNIAWWKGTNNDPTGHILSSQVACVNHLYFARMRKDIATTIIKRMDDEVKEAVVIDEGYVEFEFIGKKKYLHEKGFSRGANCTSIDAVMLGKLNDYSYRMYFIEWKYTEEYSQVDLYIPERAKVYDHLIQDKDSPFNLIPDVKAFYFEPFYQLMRQTLLADQIMKNREYEVSSYKHIHVVPNENVNLINRVTSPYFQGDNIHTIWKSLLKDKSSFIHITPIDLLATVSNCHDTISTMIYLKVRYWD
ncbi:MAG: hypothetical protein K8R73_06355 [Clostridiales bacterium]|nr:hypothetical protein [Clostridiales bacterium]